MDINLIVAIAGPSILALGLWRLWHSDRTTAAEWRGKFSERIVALERDVKELKMDMREIKASVCSIVRTLDRIEKNGQG